MGSQLALFWHRLIWTHQSQRLLLHLPQDLARVVVLLILRVCWLRLLLALNIMAGREGEVKRWIGQNHLLGQE